MFEIISIFTWFSKPACTYGFNVEKHFNKLTFFERISYESSSIKIFISNDKIMLLVKILYFK